MRLYFFAEAKWAVDNIHNGRLKVCRFLDLNDPFELFAGEQHKPFRKNMKVWAKTLNEQHGLLCFSRSWRNPLMWSHYGDRHKGICLAFDVEGTEKINYEPERLFLGNQWPSASAPAGAPADLPNELRKLLLTTKFKDWEYERERRLVLPLEGLKKEEGRFFKCFDDRLKLVAVIAGPRCCVKWKTRLEGVVKKSLVRPKLIKARLAFMGFEVVPQKHDGCPTKGFNSDRYWTECVCPPASHSTAPTDASIYAASLVSSSKTNIPALARKVR
jgi:hypothetical protein